MLGVPARGRVPLCGVAWTFVRVEHVHVNDGGQAVIGNVKKEDAKN